MEFTEVIQNRYSCKKFAPTPLAAETLTAILEAGRLAPTAKNLQGQKIYVICSAEGLSKVDAITPCRYGAPTVLAVTYSTENCFTYPGGKFNSAAEDGAIIATHMMLAARNEGVDSCWLNFFDPDKAAEILELPAREHLVMLMDLGYAAEGAAPLANHFSRKDLAETVKYL